MTSLAAEAPSALSRGVRPHIRMAPTSCLAHRHRVLPCHSTVIAHPVLGGDPVARLVQQALARCWRASTLAL